MKLLSISFTPSARIQLDKNQVEMLFQCAESHYDAECKRATRQGGILFGFRNVVEYGNPPTWSVGHNEIDLMLKILENGEGHPRIPQKPLWDLGQELRGFARKLEENTPKEIPLSE